MHERAHHDVAAAVGVQAILPFAIEQAGRVEPVLVRRLAPEHRADVFVRGDTHVAARRASAP